MLVIYDKKEQNDSFTLSQTVEIYGFESNAKECIADIDAFTQNKISEIAIDPKYFNLIIGKEACHLIQFSFLLNVDLHSRKKQCILMFCDKNNALFHQPIDAEGEGENEKLQILKQWIDQIIDHRIQTVVNVNKMRFQRLLSSKEWKEISNISYDYHESTETLRYWIDHGLYAQHSLPINLTERSEKEKEIEASVQALISYYCFDEFMSFIDIRYGFMPLIRGVDGQNILEMIEKCKKEFAQKQKDHHLKREEGGLVLDTFMRDDKDGKYESNKAHRIWIFSNNAELLRSLKISLFYLCKNGQIFDIQPIFDDLKMAQKFWIKPGMLNTRTSAKIYSNGTELFVVGNEEQRERGCKWIESMLREWKINYIGSQQQEKEKISDAVGDIQQFEEMTQHIQTQKISEINDSTLLQHF